MADSFFFYDLETSGVNPRQSRIMQFAGQRTDLDLNPIGEPYNILIKLSEDVLPEPDAVLITGITPQQTLADGITEAEFCKQFMSEIAKPGTCFVGYNSVRFDDEFMRFLLYRNFYDPYAWQWKNGASRWDLLDVVRMTRALRPEGIKWPFDENGVCTNRLELITAENKLSHDAAHDALSDVNATIDVAKMIKSKQPKLFDFLYSIRGKHKVSELVVAGKPLVYSSGRYPNEYDKTAIVVSLGLHPTSQGALMYDLRHNPTPYLKMSPDELVEVWRYNEDKTAARLPVKALQFNRTPAIAPISVLDESSQERLQINMDDINKHLELLRSDATFYTRLCEAVEKMNIERDKRAALHFRPGLKSPSVDTQLYDGFIPDVDRRIADKIPTAKPGDLSGFTDKFKDPRLKGLMPLYKARNFPGNLNDEERSVWESHREQALAGGGAESALARFGERLSELATTKTDSKDQYLLEELRLYAESIMPEVA
jgi:exodeoxyribonuclease-1